MSDKLQTDVLVEEKVALSLFLDALLREPETQNETPINTPALEVVSKIQTESIVDLKSDAQQQAQVQIDSVAPEWANEPFQVMLFKVAGLTLAVPVQGLSGVVEWTDSLTEMPGHADFYLGILQHLDKSIPVVDTASLIFPPDKIRALESDDAASRITRIVLINNSRWGLACDEVAEVITLSRDQVRWRSSRTKRRWLLGTVVDHMCALLDTDAFADRLETGAE